MKINEIRKKLNERKSDWTTFASKASISRKTIERIAAGSTDPRTSITEKLSELLANKG